jgi:hypothetical protein
MASSSQQTLVFSVIPPPSAPSPPSSFPSLPPFVLFPPSDDFPSRVEFPSQLEDPLSHTIPCSDCAYCTRFRESMSILQNLVFAVKKDVDDLLFQLEHLDQHAEKIESLLATLLHSLHSPGMVTDTPATSEAILVPTIYMVAEKEVNKHDLYRT